MCLPGRRGDDPAPAAAPPGQPLDQKGVQSPLQQLIRSLVVWRPRIREEGQGLAEYALILGLIAIVAILSLIFLGDSLADLMTMIGSNIDAAT